MIYVISKEFGTAYCKRGDEVMFYPMSTNGTFNTEEGGAVENWDDMNPIEKERIISLLNLKV